MKVISRSELKFLIDTFFETQCISHAIINVEINGRLVEAQERFGYFEKLNKAGKSVNHLGISKSISWSVFGNIQKGKQCKVILTFND